MKRAAIKIFMIAPFCSESAKQVPRGKNLSNGEKGDMSFALLDYRPGPNLAMGMPKEKIMTFLDRYVHHKSIVDLILLDHHLLREAIEAVSDDDRDPKEKILRARYFLGVLRSHSLAEERTIYPDLEGEPEFHFMILDSEVQHQLIDEKLKALIPRIAHLKVLNEYFVSELKTLVEMVSVHLENEEDTLLPLMEKSLDAHRLKNLALRFLKVRQFTPDELRSMPQVRPKGYTWKNRIANYFDQHWR